MLKFIKSLFCSPRLVEEEVTCHTQYDERTHTVSVYAVTHDGLSFCVHTEKAIAPAFACKMMPVMYFKDKMMVKR